MPADQQLVAIKKIVSLLMASSKNLSLYPANHPQTLNTIEQLWQNIFAFFRSRPQLVLSFSGSEIFFEHDLLVDESLSGEAFTNICASKKINRLIFFPGVTQNELAEFILLINQDFGVDDIDFTAQLKARSIKHIDIKRLLPGNALKKSDGAQEASDSGHQRYELALATLSEVFDQARNEQPISIERIDSIVEWLVKSIVNGDSTIVALTALKDHDEYTCHHSINVAVLAVNLGQQMGLDRDHLVWLGNGALLHDIGKINIPKEIINKPGKLTAKEWQIMKGHPIESTQILSGLPTLEKSALIVAFEHHIGFDMSGYPVRSEPRRPHLFSRIVQITDTYDGLTSKRSYHASYLPTEALNYMLCVTPKAFDPTLLRLFVSSLGVYPIGSVVRLSTKQLAVVINENKTDLLRPKVKLIDKKEGGRTIDLTEDVNLEILEVLNPESAEIDLRTELIGAT